MAKKSPEPATTTIVDRGEMLRRTLAERRTRLDTATTAATEKLDAYGLAAARAHVGQATAAEVEAARDALNTERNAVEEITAEIAGLERLIAEHEREVEAKRRADAHARAAELAVSVEQAFTASEAKLREAMAEWRAGQERLVSLVSLLESLAPGRGFGAFVAPAHRFGPPTDAQAQWTSALGFLLADESAGRLPPPSSMRPAEWAIQPAFAERVKFFVQAALASTEPAPTESPTVETEAA